LRLSGPSPVPFPAALALDVAGGLLLSLAFATLAMVIALISAPVCLAAHLVIAPKTASNHVEHIYTKIGATNRAGASLYAMRHGLVPVEA